MRFSRCFTGLCMTVWLAGQPATADIDPAEYQLQSSVRNDQERKRLQAEFEVDRQKEAALQRRDEEATAQQQAADKAAWDRLPYPVRLTQTRCTLCHEALNYANQRHNRVGWELVMLRMQYVNEATIGAGERSVIAAHLAEAYPALGVESLVEALQQLAVLLSPLWLWLAWKVTRSRWGR